MKHASISTIVTAALIAGAGYSYFTPDRDGNGLIPPAYAQSDETQTQQVALPEIPDYMLGDPDAPVTVIEYASFTCTYCGAFHTDGFQKLKADYIDTNKVKFINREVYFDRYGLWAAMLARCGGEAKYYGIVDLLFKSQQEWSQAGSDTAVIERLYDIGRIAGFDDTQMDACYGDAANAQAMVATYQKNAKADGINATPSFVIDGKLYPNRSYAELSAAIDAALGQ